MIVPHDGEVEIYEIADLEADAWTEGIVECEGTVFD